MTHLEHERPGERVRYETASIAGAVLELTIIDVAGLLTIYCSTKRM